jgi:hypothetical protein
MTYAHPLPPARAPPNRLTPAPLTSQFRLERPQCGQKLLSVQVRQRLIGQGPDIAQLVLRIRRRAQRHHHDTKASLTIISTSADAAGMSFFGRTRNGYRQPYPPRHC